MKVICIAGKAQHGKDTTAKMMREILEDKGYCVLITHYADLVKYICKTFFGWNGEKDEYGRTLLQKVGTDIVRTQRPDFWVDFIVDVLKLFDGQWDFVLIPDCRFPNECDRIKAEFDAQILRVNRNNYATNLTEKQQKHPSEVSLDTYDFDAYIENDGTEDGLYKIVKKWIEDNI